MDRARYADVLRRLAANQVEFVVVGMMAGDLKEKTGRPKDLAVLPVLHATLAETRRRT